MVAMKNQQTNLELMLGECKLNEAHFNAPSAERRPKLILMDLFDLEKLHLREPNNKWFSYLYNLGNQTA